MARPPLINKISDTTYTLVDRINYLLTSFLENAGGVPSIKLDTFAKRPATAEEGAIFIASDNNLIYQYRGTSWNQIGGAETIDWSDITNKVMASSTQDGILSKTDYQEFKGKEDASEKGKPNGYASLDSSGIVPTSQLPNNLKEIRIVPDIAARDALDKFEGLRAHVIDAIDDPTVTSGWAEYLCDGTNWTKTSDKDSLDIVLDWNNLQGKPVSTATDIDAAVTHSKATGNPHGTTKANLGLGNVENKSSATIRSELTSADVTKALTYTPLSPTDKQAIDGEISKINKREEYVIHLSDYITDYAADNSSVIQTVLNAILSNNSVVTTVVFPNRLLNVSGLQLLNKKSVKLLGGRLKGMSTGGQSVLIIEGGGDITIEGMEIQGNNTHNFGISSSGVEGLRILNCKLSLFRTSVANVDTTAAVYLGSGCKDVLIQGNKLTDVQATGADANGDAQSSVGIWVDPGTGTSTVRFVFSHNYIQNIKGPATGTIPAPGMQSNADGIKIAGEVKTNVQGVISSNTFTLCEKRAVKCQADGVDILNNRIRSEGLVKPFSAISVYGNYCLIQGNNILAGGVVFDNIIEIQSGIGLHILDNTAVNWNTDYETSNGVLVISAVNLTGSYSTDIKIARNNFTNVGNGVHLTGNTNIDDISIESNRMSQLSASFIKLLSGSTAAMHNLRVRDNVLSQLGQYVINMPNSALKSCVAEGNIYQSVWYKFVPETFDKYLSSYVFRNNWKKMFYTDSSGHLVQFRDPDYISGIAYFTYDSSDGSMSVGSTGDQFQAISWKVGDRLTPNSKTTPVSAGKICVKGGVICTIPWAANTQYVPDGMNNNLRYTPAGGVYQCLQGGTSGATPPTGTGTNIVDGTTLWAYIGELAAFTDYGVVGDVSYRTDRSGKDVNGVFTTITYKRPNGSTYKTSVLSGGTSPKYNTRTETYYDEAGNAVRTKMFSLTYDGDGDLIAEVPVN
ncbi:hypothetical protein D1872_50460 [compost metagenome]